MRADPETSVRSLERLMQRRQLRAIINDDSILVSFVRQTKVATDNGSWKPGPAVTLPPQQVRLVPFLRRLADTMVDSQFGEIPNVRYVLVGPHDLDVQVGDSFQFEGLPVRIDAVDPFREVRTSCAVVFYG